MLEVSDAAFVCPNPECRKPLVPVDAPRAKRSRGLPSLGLIAAFGAAVVGIAVASYYFFLQTPAAPSTKPVAAWIKELSIER